MSNGTRVQANAMKVSRRMKKPHTPAQHAADVVEHVLATDGEDYLETAEHLYAWWQLALLDVYAALVLAGLLLLGAICGAFWVLFCSLKLLYQEF